MQQAPSGPHLSQSTHTGQLMLQVLLALIPGIAAMTWVFGFGIIINIMLAITSAVVMEAAMLAVRKRPIISALKDNSAMLSGVLLALSIPPLTSWWIIIIGILFAIVVAKHLYGGLGFNVFNPAMVGYAVLMISFPLQMTVWPDLELPRLSLNETRDWQFNNQLPTAMKLDAITSATPLDLLRTATRSNASAANIKQLAVIHEHVWILASAWLIGGFWLIYRRIAAWQLPTAFLGSYAVLSGIYWLIGSVQATPLFYLLHGSLIMAAFFIVTDPVTVPMTPNGRLIAGALVGMLVFIIRSWGGYPEGVAFAVLLMNLTVPLIDRYV
ncbi:MAG: RnfABCDGE type electron transport complex subunit D [Methylococcales bacterium]